MGCRERKEKQKLIRLCAGEGGRLQIDLRGGSPGRGVYLCPGVECIRSAVKRNSLGRGLRGRVEDGGAGWLEGTILRAIEEELKEVFQSELDFHHGDETAREIASFSHRDKKKGERASLLWYKYRCLKNVEEIS